MSEKKMVHGEKYADAIKVASKFTAKNNLRMVLQMVNHKADGSIEVTDSRRALIVKDVHGFKEDYGVNVKSLEFFRIDFPDLQAVIPSEGKHVFKLNEPQIKVWLQMHRSMNQMSKLPSLRNQLNLLLNNDGFKFEINNADIEFKLPVEEYEKPEEFEFVAYDIEFMRDALEAHAVLGTKELFVQIDGPHRPILLTNKEDVKAIVLPIRVHN